MARSHPPSLTLIIDADPEVCRLGYGTVEWLTALQALANDQMLPIRYQPGLRLGVLVADARMWVYAPTPLLIEAGAKRADQPNAMALGAGDPLLDVLMACAADGAPANAGALPAQAELGAQAATPALLQHSLQDLQRLPPKPVATSIRDLGRSLLPGVMKRPPARLTKQSLSAQPTEAEFRAAIEADLSNAFKAGDRFFQPTVKVVFKDLTYETIKDEKFVEQLKHAFPGLGQQGLFDEHDAAPEFAPQSPMTLKSDQSG